MTGRRGAQAHGGPRGEGRMARRGFQEESSQEVERVLAAEREARQAEDTAREQAEAARAQARHIAARAEERISALHRRTSASLQRRSEEIEADAARRLANAQARPADAELLERVAAELAAELSTSREPSDGGAGA